MDSGMTSAGDSADATVPGRCLHVVDYSAGNVACLSVTAGPDTGATLEEMHEAGLSALRERSLEVVSENVFAPRDQGDILEKWSCHWPVTWVDSGHASGSQLRGIHLLGFGGDIERIEMYGRVVGSVYEFDGSTYCRLGDIRTADMSVDREDQARRTFIDIEEGLKLAGMDFDDVCRTWLYIDDILDWYREFNLTRDDFFSHRDIFEKIVPASTGIGGANPYGASVIADALAIRGGDGFSIRPLPSPLQNPALDYGSSFSRAVEITQPTSRSILVSGTASIDAEGTTVHVDDVAAQVDQTMRVIAAILESNDMEWSDVTRCIAYCKEAETAAIYTDYLGNNAVPSFPTIITENDICRDDLLFEAEVDAVVVGG